MTPRQEDQALHERLSAENLARANGEEVLTFHGVPIVWNPVMEDSPEARMAWAALNGREHG